MDIGIVIDKVTIKTMIKKAKHSLSPRIYALVKDGDSWDCSVKIMYSTLWKAEEVRVSRALQY